MKKQRLMIAIASALAIGTAHAQIPVTDGAAIAQQAQQFAQEIAKWTQQINHMKTQVETMKKQYESITGIRNLGDIMNNPMFKDYLPKDWQKVYDAVRAGGYAGLTGSGASVYAKNKIYDGCKVLAGVQKTICESALVKGSMDQGYTIDAFEKATKRLNQIEGLMKSINSTKDQKAIEEIQGRIASEQAMIQNEAIKMQLFQMVSDAQDKIIRQRAREANMELAARKGAAQFKEVQF